MTITKPVDAVSDVEGEQSRSSLSTAAARNLASTTKSAPQMQEISPRWLLRMLPWVEVPGGAYRVNRRLTYAIGDGRLTFTSVGSRIRVIPAELRELPLLRDLDDTDVLDELAIHFEQREFAAGEMIATAGQLADQVFLIAHGKVNKIGTGQYGDRTTLGVLAEGQYFGEDVLSGQDTYWQYATQAVTACTMLCLDRSAIRGLMTRSAVLEEHIRHVLSSARPPHNKHGEAAIELAAGHDGEPVLPGTFVDYEGSPREYELSVAQTVLRVHSRVADLYNQPMDQVEQQLRLTVEALRERQEYELVNNRDFGLLHNVDIKQRVSARSGPPTPDDMDDLLCRRRGTKLFLAHPQAIAAFGRECNSRGLYPPTVTVEGRSVFAWRGVPVLPCDKLPLSKSGATSILAMRTGEDDQGVIGLRQTGIPDEYAPGLSVRFMGINDQAIISYLVSAYYSVAALVPDALGVLDNVETGH